jgi:hypothetical protein
MIIEDGFGYILFVKFCNNEANLLTKIVSKDSYIKYVGEFLGKVRMRLRV